MTTKPPPSNRGVPNFDPPSFCIDWLRISCADEGAAYALLQRCGIRAARLSDSQSQPTPLPHYNQAVQMEWGRIDWHNTRPEQRALITLTGEDLYEWGRVGGWAYELVHAALFEGDCRITRIDVAMDVYDPVAAPEDVYAAMQSGEVDTRIKTYNIIRSVTAGGEEAQTVYLGSRQSTRIVRIYDKAKQGGLDCAWTRVEIEAKYPHSHQLAKLVVEHGVKRATIALFRDLAHVPVSWLQNALGSAVATLVEPVGRKETSREKWLRETVLPLVRAEVLGGADWIADELRAILDARDMSAGHGL